MWLDYVVPEGVSQICKGINQLKPSQEKLTSNKNYFS